MPFARLFSIFRIQKFPAFLLLATLPVLLTGCGEARQPLEAGVGENPQLLDPQPPVIPIVQVALAVGWPPGGKPTPAPGMAVEAFASGLDHPRWIYVLPNGDVLVAESNAPDDTEGRSGIIGFFSRFISGFASAGTISADRITLLRDTDANGVADLRSTFLEDLYSPFGMALIGNDFYVANTDAILRFPYEAGQVAITAAGEKIVDLPAGSINVHWTRNIIASRDGTRLYATVGSNSNIGERGMDQEIGRAAVWEIDLATKTKRLFATGLRNPNGLSWEPESGVLWTTVNERDALGSDLVPDYMTSVQDGAFYGWPYSYYGQNIDTRVKPARPDLVATAIAPDYALGAHTACLGLTFSEGSTLPSPFRSGAFVGQHGSWGRIPKSGYKVIFVPFAEGRPSGPPVDVLTGFLSPQDTAYGRPVGVTFDKTGALLVADDVGNIIWRVFGNGTND